MVACENDNENVGLFKILETVVTVVHAGQHEIGGRLPDLEILSLLDCLGRAFPTNFDAREDTDIGAFRDTVTGAGAAFAGDI